VQSGVTACVRLVDLQPFTSPSPSCPFSQRHGCQSLQADGHKAAASSNSATSLSNLGYEIARGTIADILERHGIEPVPERSRKTTWKEFLRQHWELLVAADFFAIEA